MLLIYEMTGRHLLIKNLRFSILLIISKNTFEELRNFITNSTNKLSKMPRYVSTCFRKPYNMKGHFNCAVLFTISGKQFVKIKNGMATIQFNVEINDKMRFRII